MGGLEEDDQKLGKEALALIDANDSDGLQKLLSAKPVEVRLTYDTVNGRKERLDEYAERMGKDTMVRILRDAGAPEPDMLAAKNRPAGAKPGKPSF